MVDRIRALLVFLAMFGAAGPLRAEVIDRILAVVDTQIVTLSDARAALKFSLVPEDVATDPIAAVLQRLIDRRLMLAEVDRYAPPEPTPAAVDAAMAVVERRFKDTLEMEIALNQSAMSREELRRYVRDTLRLETYFQQRFSTVVQPSEDEILRYYREHAAEFTVSGQLQSLAAARDAVRTAVIREQRDVLVRQWVEGLRRRGAVQLLYLPQAGK
jgi:peptidyl-prolyl cis-trans isomerase SurA